MCHRNASKAATIIMFGSFHLLLFQNHARAAPPTPFSVAGDFGARSNSSGQISLRSPASIALKTNAGHMFWTDVFEGKILRANLDGSDAIELPLAPLSSPYGLALHESGSAIYFTESGTGKLRRADLDGSNTQDIVTGLKIPRSLSLDEKAQMIYWTDAASNKIQRAGLTGEGVTDIVLTGQDLLADLALDVQAGHIYWADNLGAIRRADFLGTNVVTVVTYAQARPSGIALDLVGDQLYWSDSYDYKLRRANLDGSSVEVLVNELNTPWKLALDLEAGKIYITCGDRCTAQIKRCNLDGSDLEILLRNFCHPIDLFCTPLGGSQVSGGQLVDVECFATTDQDQQLTYMDLDLACSLPGQPGATGSVDSVLVMTDPDADFQPGPSSTGIPYLFGPNGCCTDPDQKECEVYGQAPLPNPSLLAAGQIRYLATVRYQVSDCAAGDFNVVLENFSDPPHPNDETQFLGPPGGFVPFNYTPLVLTATPRSFGDVVPNGAVDVDDILCSLAGFMNLPDCPGADLTSPALPCTGEGLIDVDDILAILDAFSGLATCPGPCG